MFQRVELTEFIHQFRHIEVMKTKIIKLAKDLKISSVGFLCAREFSELLPEMSKDIPFVTATPEERINPFKISDKAKTIIAMAVSYYTKTEGNISMYARGIDYHNVIKKISEPIIRLLEESGFWACAFCDDAPLDERFLAQASGIGFIGKNGFLITPEYGSFVFLGHIVTDCEIEPDMPNKLSCKECGRCIKACPTKALSTGDFYTCLSYITQRKGELSKREEDLIRQNGTCWGCDICQKVCPHNEGLPVTEIPEFAEDLILSLENMPESNRAFRKLYNERAFSWRGKGVIERNLNILNKR